MINLKTVFISITVLVIIILSYSIITLDKPSENVEKEYDDILLEIQHLEKEYNELLELQKMYKQGTIKFA